MKKFEVGKCYKRNWDSGCESSYLNVFAEMDWPIRGKVVLTVTNQECINVINKNDDMCMDCTEWIEISEQEWREETAKWAYTNRSYSSVSWSTDKGK